MLNQILDYPQLLEFSQNLSKIQTNATNSCQTLFRSLLCRILAKFENKWDLGLWSICLHRGTTTISTTLYHLTLLSLVLIYSALYPKVSQMTSPSNACSPWHKTMPRTLHMSPNSCIDPIVHTPALSHLAKHVTHLGLTSQKLAVPL
jgi:hypothetical protein